MMKSAITRAIGWLRGEDGHALAELAIIVPFLLVMLAAVCEIGRFFQNYTTLAKSTRAAARYVSNHPLTPLELDRAQSVAVCGKLACTDADKPLLPNLSKGNICIEKTGSPKILTVTVRIPRTGSPCSPAPGANNASAYVYSPIFDIGAILGTSFTLKVPIAPRTTMYYMID